MDRFVSIRGTINHQVEISPGLAHHRDELLPGAIRIGGVVVIHQGQVALRRQGTADFFLHRHRGFFGRLREEGGLRRYLERTKRIVYVISEHRGQSDDLRKNGMEPEATMAYLGSLPDIAFTAEHFEADFHQPLKDRKEALRYIERMYGSGNAERYMAFLMEDGDGLLLPNHKHATIFTIERRSV